jgi:ribosomal protein L23
MSESLNDQLRAAYENIVEKQEPEPLEVVTEAPAEIVEDTKEEAVEAEEAEIVEEDIDAPEHWAQEDKETFKAVDRKAKDFLLKRHKEMQSDYTKKQQELSEQVRIADKYRQAIAPHEEYLRQHGIDPTQAFERMISTEKTLRLSPAAEKAKALQDVARQYGVELDPSQEQPQIDETTKAIFDELKQQRAYILNLEHQRKAQEQQSAQETIEAFSNAKDESGKLKYPHFETVKVKMGELLQTGLVKTTDLAEVYEHAILLDKDLRKSYLAQQDAVTKLNEAARQKAAASKRAGSMNIKSGTSAEVKDDRKPENLRDTLRRAWEQSQGR